MLTIFSAFVKSRFFSLSLVLWYSIFERHVILLAQKKVTLSMQYNGVVSGATAAAVVVILTQFFI